MRIDIVSLFPEFVDQCAGFGVTGRARERGLLSLHGWNPRDHAEGNYRKVDDRTFGGGPGMVMLVEPLRRCLQAMRAADPVPPHVVYLSPQGRPLDQARVRGLAALPRLALLCGRYEGVDERLVQAEVDEEVSIGDYVLSGGELAAAVVVDAVARLQDGALNDAGSAEQDSFEDGLLDCPHYSHPVEHAYGTVPEVLRSGNHAAIARWRRQQALGRTWERRPDLLQGRTLSKADQALLDAWRRERGEPGSP
ncbi:tRNA (guanosine(37)-N1)-methyltransferase TrmD [Pseudoxanthomonas koreensis]|uniref:tRNA (guanosine(37)-N1)-methyltransferase TrmD n=1 Tax=Pseudoxanthomonas koreensis TaxID=266061 RepID=UPI0013912D1A|nr:tRNA (guanosine(37)-N1)-methyltransferase TrmD [Pseudoxanthomonas koreensis]KAF1696081.1 tRNA (guanosine(37)-N1)-methyltransferase TrmD [Pseudoxanthomonas koreensis]